MLLLFRSLLERRAPVEIKPSGGGSANRDAGPDAQISVSDWLRRFGRKDAPPERVSDDEEAIALILCALASDSRT